MARGSRKISVEILGDSTSLERAFGRSARAGKEMQVGFAGLGRSGLKAGAGFFAATQGLSAVSDVIQESVDAASNLTEQTTKSQAVFRNSSAEIEAWGKTTAKSFGIANDQALEAASTFGNLFRTVHLAPAEAAAMSRALVELAADLASFNNADPSEVLIALRSGLVGEAEPMRKLGARLSEVRVQQEAMATTGKKNAKALSEQEKMLARYKIILDDTKLAQGDFAKTQDSFANKSRALEAELRDLKAELGQGLIPVLTVLIDLTSDLVSGVNKLGRAYMNLPSTHFLEGLGAATFEVGEALGFAGDNGEKYAAALANVAEHQKEVLSFSGALKEHLEMVGTGGDRVADPGKLPPKKYTAEQRNEWFDAMIGRREDRVQDVAELEGQIVELQKIAALIEKRISVTKDTTRKLNLEDQLLNVQRDIRSTRDRIAARTEQVREERAALAKERAEREALARETAQFGLLGLGEGGADPVPGVGALRRRLTRVGEAVKGTILDTGKTRSLLANMRKLLSGEMGKLSEDVRSKMEQLLADLDQTLDEHSRKRSRVRMADPDRILAGLGLSREQIRALSGRIAGIGKGGTMALGGPAAFGMRLQGAGGIVVTGPVIVKTDNPDVLARELQKRARRQAVQTRGTRPGSRQGVDS
jgi:hypothetical protein